MELVVTGYDNNKNLNTIRNRLQNLVSNTGGKVSSITPEKAVVRFSSKDSAQRFVHTCKNWI